MVTNLKRGRVTLFEKCISLDFSGNTRTNSKTNENPSDGIMIHLYQHKLDVIVITFKQVSEPKQTLTNKKLKIYFEIYVFTISSYIYNLGFLNLRTNSR